jgi:hypothetical protein
MAGAIRLPISSKPNQSVTGTGSAGGSAGSEWVRPSDWIDISDVADNEINLLVSDQHTRYAFAVTTASGGYSIDWGDGNNDANPVSFQETGDTVIKPAHGLVNKSIIRFSSITATTGILINTNYYVVGATDDTFQLALLSNGAAINLTNDGTGIMQRVSGQTYQHQYAKGAGTACSEGYTTFKIRIYGASSNITSWKVQRHTYMQEVQDQAILWAVFGTRGIADYSYAFSNCVNISNNTYVYCRQLREVVIPSFTNTTNCYGMFNKCSALISVSFGVA